MDYQFAAKDWDNGSVAIEVKGLDDWIDDDDTVTYIYASIFSSTDPVYGASTFDTSDNLTFVNVDNDTETLCNDTTHTPKFNTIGQLFIESTCFD